MEEYFITCPYCLEQISVLLDTGSQGRTDLVDDCEVCCRPIEIRYTVEDYQVKNLSYNPIEGNEF